MSMISHPNKEFLTDTVRLCVVGPGAYSCNTTERSELYRPNDSRTATLDLKGRRGRQGSVPFADTEDDRNLGAMDPNNPEHEVCDRYTHMM